MDENLENKKKYIKFCNAILIWVKILADLHNLLAIVILVYPVWNNYKLHRNNYFDAGR